PMYGVDEDALMGAVFAYSGGYGSANQGIGSLVPNDYEVRFTSTGGKAINYWGDESVIDVPFEWWNVGDPTDATDDFQLVPYLLDEDDNGEWNLQYGSEDADHGTSGGLNDPWTDRVYVLTPVDDTPGTDGYDNFMTGAAAGDALPAWYATPANDGSATDAWQTFGRTVFMEWNGGDVTAATSPADYTAEEPETGTIFYIATTKPNTTADKFTFDKELNAGTSKSYNVADVNVWPNPYFGYNPEERDPVDQQMHFTHLPETGKYNIRIFDLAGNHIKTITGEDAESQFAVWDLRNDFGIPVASGMYIAHVEYGSKSKVLKLAVVQPEQRLDRY
ncbi:MAG: T9SS type A sorting domain-containing protein, partial [Fidelibacterota bacterium]